MTDKQENRQDAKHPSETLCYLDIDSLLIDKIIAAGGDKEDFYSVSSFITEYASKTGRPEDGIALIFIDSLSCGMSVDQLRTQCEVYDATGKCDFLR